MERIMYWVGVITVLAVLGFGVCDIATRIRMSNHIRAIWPRMVDEL